MLNIFNLKLLQKYNHAKTAVMPYSNYRTRINEQIKKKIKNSSIAKKINNDTTINELITDYLNSKSAFDADSINYLLDEILADNKIRISVFDKNIVNYVPSETFKDNDFIIVSDFNADLNKLLEEISNSYCPFFTSKNLQNKYDTPTDFTFQNSKETKFIIYYLKKLAIFYLFFKYNENETTFRKSGAYQIYQKTDAMDLEKCKNTIYKISNSTIILPFLRQNYSKEHSLVIDNSHCFGTLSKEILINFFLNTPIDINPYNYKYWGQTAYINNRNTYSYTKYLEFINTFHNILSKNNNLQTHLKYDLLELLFHINFIFYNVCFSTLRLALKPEYLESKDTIKNWSCRFFYNTSIIPMPEYRIFLSSLFYKKSHIAINTNNDFYKQKTNILNAKIERLATQIIPKFLKSIDSLIELKYQNNKASLNKDLYDTWNILLKQKQAHYNCAYLMPLFNVNIYNDLIPHLFENSCISKFKKTYIDIRKLIEEDKYASKAFSYLHELVFSSLYFDKNNNTFFNNDKTTTILHAAPQINNYRIINPEQDFTNWCRDNKDKYEYLKNLNDF